MTVRPSVVEGELGLDRCTEAGPTAPTGAVKVSCVSLATLKATAGLPFTSMLSMPVKPLPVRATSVPPVVDRTDRSIALTMIGVK